MKKRTKIIIIVVLLILYLLLLTYHFTRGFYQKFTLGDYGIELTTLISFVKKDSKDLVTLYDPKNQIMLNAKELKGDFWKSDSMDEIMDGYIRLISAMNYDCSIRDVTLKARKIDSKEVGVVSMNLDKFGTVERVTTVLTHKANGYVAIEIYGHLEAFNKNQRMINGIINSIQFTTNTHDYSKDSEIDRSKLSGDNIFISGDSKITISGEENNGGNSNE